MFEQVQAQAEYPSYWDKKIFNSSYPTKDSSCLRALHKMMWHIPYSDLGPSRIWLIFDPVLFSGKFSTGVQNRRLRPLPGDLWRQRRRRLHDPRRKNSGPVDSPRSDRVPEVHIGVRRLEFRHRHVGGHVLRRETLLDLVQPRCDQGHREELPSSRANGLPGSHPSADARLLAEGARAQTELPINCQDFG